MGYKAVIYPLTALRAAMRAAEEVLKTLRDQGTQQSLLEPHADPRRALRFARLQDWEERDRGYFTSEPP